tara:strand:- start:26769 stop:27599 length:831 start_codon:yes stop_codon:yes gene_type:complete
MPEYTDDQLKEMENTIDEVSSDYKDLLQSAGIDFKKAKAAMRAHIRGRKKDTSDISSSVEEAQKKAEKALANFASVNTLISSRNTLNVELRKPKKSNANRHARDSLQVLKHMSKRISDLEEDAYDANPDVNTDPKAYVTEVHQLEPSDIETDHLINLDVRESMKAAAKTSASGVSLIMVRAFCAHKHYWKSPEEPTNSPLSSDRDRYRAKCQTSFYGVVSMDEMPNVGDIITVEYPDPTDFSCGIIKEIYLRLPAVKTPFNARSAFNGAGSTRVGN